MPTGYTDNIKELDRNQFIMQCARAMGACISMRDEPWDTPIPDQFEPESFYQQHLEEAIEQLKTIKKTSTIRLRKEITKEIERIRQNIVKDDQEKRELLIAYHSMRNEICNWIPPSSDHVEFKKFMLEQIETSIEYDCFDSKSYYMGKIDRLICLLHLPDDELRKCKINEAMKEVDYRRTEYEKECERVNRRSLWIRQLKESLKQ